MPGWFLTLWGPLAWGGVERGKAASAYLHGAFFADADYGMSVIVVRGTQEVSAKVTAG